NLLRKRIATRGGVEDDFGREGVRRFQVARQRRWSAGGLGQSFERAFDYRRCAGVRLQAAPASAAALARPGDFDLHVAQFGAVAMLPFDDFAAPDNAAADTRAKR